MRPIWRVGSIPKEFWPGQIRLKGMREIPHARRTRDAGHKPYDVCVAVALSAVIRTVISFGVGIDHCNRGSN